MCGGRGDRKQKIANVSHWNSFPWTVPCILVDVLDRYSTVESVVIALIVAICGKIRRYDHMSHGGVKAGSPLWLRTKKNVLYVGMVFMNVRENNGLRLG